VTEPNEPGPDELAERLRRLFADDGLTLPVAVTADREVVSGARRRRRRRLTAAASGGVVAVAALVFAVVGLTGVTRPRGTIGAAAGRPALSQTLTATSEPASPPRTTTPADQLDVLGPVGTDGLYLGMPLEQALRTRGNVVVGHQSASGTCIGYTLLVRPSAVRDTTPVPPTVTAPAPSRVTPVPPPSAATRPPLPKRLLISVLVSKSAGVVQLGGVAGLRTPEGVAPGTPEQQVFRTYRKVVPGDRPSELATPAPGGKGQASYVFAIGRDGAVDQLWLRKGFRLDCRK
jgi:hypothetical protein